MNTPFSKLDGRTEHCRNLRQRAYAVLGGESQYYESGYMRQMLAQRVAMLEEMISNMEVNNQDGSNNGVIIQANNSLLGM